MRRCIRHIGYVLPAFTLLLLISPARAADAVEELRLALSTPFPPTMNEAEKQYQLKYRCDLLEKRVKALGVGDLRRALALQEWRDTDREFDIRDLDGGLRGQVVARLEKTLLQLLQARSVPARRAAITQIGELGVQIRGQDDAPLARGLAPELVKLFGDPDPIVRAEAVQAFGRIDPDHKLVPEAGKLLHDPDPAVRQAAADALVALVGTIEPLLRSRGHTGIAISRSEAAMLGRAAALAARGGMAQKSPSIRQSSMEAIHRATVLLRDLVLDPTRQDFPPADRRPTDDERADIRRYRQNVEDERADVMPLIHGLEELVADVAQALDDPQAEIRLLAIKTLEEIGVGRQRLIRKAQSVPRIPERKDVRGPGDGTTFVLLQADPLDADPLGPKLIAALPQVEAALRDPDVRVRRIAVNVLEALERDPEVVQAVPAVTRALADRDQFVRWSAARLLGRIGPVQTEVTIPALARLLTDGNLDVQMAAATALSRLGPKAAAAVPTLAAQVSRGDPENRVEMIQALEAINLASPVAVQSLGAGLADDDPRVRLAAAIALRSFGARAQAAIPELEAALNDRDEAVREAVSDALLAVTAK